MLPWSLFLLIVKSFASTTKRTYSSHNYYVVEHNPQSHSIQDAANYLGVEVVEQVGQLANHWLVRAEKIRLREEADVVQAKYNDLYTRQLHPNYGIRSLTVQVPKQRAKRAPPPLSSERISAERLGINDPIFPQQWHLINDEFPEHDMNVTGLWEIGITGKGVISSLLDDGLDYESADLADNFDAANSHDFNDHTDLPTPKLSDDNHGTRCAGQIAAVKNDVCGVGIAYESKVAGVRILSGALTDADEAAALNFGYQDVSVYSCSWGPPDDGKTMEAPSYLIKKAILNGINNGRGGKGSVFVFASGNGAGSGDQCNFDGYTNSIYSVTVSAIDYKGLHPYYSEPCAANLIVAYSSGSGKSIVTSDRGGKCAYGHGGTSAAAPNASGVFVLALQVRPELTWRDIQYLCIHTARMVNEDDPDWETTASGRKYSYKYGYGALDGYRFVTAAKDWELVKPQARIKTHSVQLNQGEMTKAGSYSGGEFITSEGVSSTITITSDMLQANNFQSLEHINVKVWISHAKRGDVGVEIVSPNGITSVLARQRMGDKDKDGFPGWTFMSIKHWSEDPIGEWTIKVTDAGAPELNGSFIGWSMVFWGSSIDPERSILYDVSSDDEEFPPLEDIPTTSPTPSTTRTLTRPTAHLPGDHDTAEGENTNPAFSPGVPSATSSPYPGWIPGMSSLRKNPKWFFGAIGAVAIFGIAVGVFFWRRKVNRRRAAYTALGNESVNMADLSGNRNRTRELYDAFGEVSDEEGATLLRDEEREDELHRGADLSYRDEPVIVAAIPDRRETDSPSSGDGSWVHTS